MPSAAEFIGKHEGEIFERWFDEASRVASARGFDRPAVTNVMPRYLSGLSNAKGDLGEFTGERRKHVESHLASRIRQGYSVEEIVEEFILLGRCAQRIWDADVPEARPVAVEMDRLWAELHRAAAAVTDMFARHMAEDEQSEKRYLKQLQVFANAALQKEAVPFRDRLREALEMIMEAMAAQSAALLLYHPESEQLVNTASAGVEEMEHFVTSVDPSSFAGQVAASEETTEIEDVPTTRLTIPPSLRRSGIHSLLGMRLPTHRTLVGVLYIGIAEPRAFSARESRRLEALGEQLTVHLDNAALAAALEGRLRVLDAERKALRVERDLRERFVSVLAHDLRGPLSAAKFAAQLLMARGDGLDDNGRKLAIKIDRNLDRTDRMVRDLLDANRIQAGERLPLRLDTCDLGAVAREVAEELSDIYGERFIVDAEHEVRGIWSADELRRALWNLATNAAKYGAPNRPITIAVVSKSEGVALRVHNEGAPIPPDDRSELYRPFSRARAAQPGGPRGWGLGLTLVHGCAEAHGGRVTVESDASKGTTFTVELPWDSRSFQAHAAEASAAQATP